MDVVQTSANKRCGMEPLTREEHIEKFGQLSLLLADVARTNDEARKAVCEAVSAECIQCSINISGTELLELADPGVQNPNAKVQRLRQGYCARQGCNAYFYRVKFLPHASVDWPNVLSPLDAPKEGHQSNTVQAIEKVITSKRIQDREYMIRACIALSVLGFVLLAWHWYRGGSVPIIREPEKFKVDVRTNQTALPRFAE